MRFLIITQYYPPETGAPQNRLSEMASILADQGHHVTVLTAMPSYPKGIIFSGYGGLLRRESENGMTIIRTYIYPTQSTALIKRLLNYFSFVASSVLIGGWFIGKQDFILTESPPLFLGVSGYLMSLWKNARWIFNVSDLWPESAVRLGIINRGILYSISKALENFCYKQADVVTGQSVSIIENIRKRFPNLITYHLSNGADTVLFHPDIPAMAYDKLINVKSDNIILYAGLHGLAQGLDQIIDAAKRLHNEDGIHFVFLGDGPRKKELMKKAASLKLKNVTFLAPVDREQMPSMIAGADIIVVPLKVYIPGAVPSKIYEAMACAKPIILMASGESANIISKSNAGIVLSPLDIDGLVSALLTLNSDKGKRDKYGFYGRQAAVTQFDRKQIVKRFINFLNSSPCIL